MKIKFSGKEKILLIISVLLVLTSIVFAIDSTSSNFNTNSTIMTGGGSINVTSSNFENYDINIPYISNNASSENFISSIGFIYSSDFELSETITTTSTDVSSTTIATGSSSTGGGVTSAPSIDPLSISEILSQGSNIEKKITIRNTFGEPTIVKVSLDGINIIKISPEEFTLLARESQIVTLTISVPKDQQAGIYSGMLLIRTDRSLTNIPITIGVEEKSLKESFEEKLTESVKDISEIKKKDIQKIVLIITSIVSLIMLILVVYNKVKKLLEKGLPKTERVLVEYIKKAKRLGMSKKEIKGELIIAKWPRKLIKKHLK